jgi:tetratricopeptide (TPR) repeat protein
MSDGIFKKISYLVGLLPIGAIFGLAAYMAQIEIKDLDLWLHLGVGRFIMQNHYIPWNDVLSCTIAGKPWINHEWLFQVIVYNIFTTWGTDGLINMQIVIVLATLIILLFLGYTRENQLAVGLFLFFVYLIYQSRFTIRPDLYSLFFFALYIYILAIHIDKKWSVFVLFLVQTLWVNIHGFFFFGPLFILIALLSEFIKRKVKLPYEWNTIGRLTDDEYNRLKLILGVVIFACLLNPYFHRGAIYPFHVLFSIHGEGKIFFDWIQELQKPVTWATIFDQDKAIHYKLLILISFVTFIFNRRKIDISTFFIWLVFLFFSLQAMRNLPFFAFASYLVIMTNILTIPFEAILPLRFNEPRFYYITEAVAKLLLFLYIFQFSQGIVGMRYYDFNKYEYKREFRGVSLQSYPNKAVDFLVQNRIKGNFLNDFNSGAYLVGRTSPYIHVFIDGRTEVYGAEFFKFYQKVWEGKDSALIQQAIDKYQITGAFLNSTHHHIPSGLINFFYKNPQWKLVYLDYDAVIFLKDVAFNKNYLNKLALDWSKIKPLRTDLVRLGVERVLPYQNYYRAYTLESVGQDDLALAECEIALKVNPSYGDVYSLMGKIYAKKKQFEKAFESFRIAATISGNEKESRYNLALALSDLSQYNGAINQYNQIRNIWPSETKAIFLLAKAFIQNGQYKEAEETLKQAYSNDHRAVSDVLGLADMMLEKKQYRFAREVYNLVVDEPSFQSSSYNKIAESYIQERDYTNALGSLEKALKASPGNEELKNRVKDVLEKVK